MAGRREGRGTSPRRRELKESVLDANAVISYLRSKDSVNSAAVDRLVDLAVRREAMLFISPINFGEVFYILRKTVPEDRARRTISKISNLASVIEVNSETAIGAAQLKARYKLGYADSFAALLALERKTTLVSADPHFEKLGRTLKLLKLQPFRDKN